MLENNELFLSFILQIHHSEFNMVKQLFLLIDIIHTFKHTLK